MPSSAITALYTLSLHDALPISDEVTDAVALDALVADFEARGVEFQIVGLGDPLHPQVVGAEGADRDRDLLEAFLPLAGGDDDFLRSEEHTSELQSRENLVCRLLRSPRSTLFPYTTLFRSRMK